MTSPPDAPLAGPGAAARPHVLLVDSQGACHGGAEAMVDEILHRADTSRFRVSFATLHEGPWPERLRGEGYDVHVFEVTRWRDVGNVRDSAAAIARTVRDEGVDLVHASGSSSLLHASLGARRARTPLVWTVFDPLTGMSPRRLLTARRHVTARLLGLLHPDHVIFGTATASRGVPRRRGTPTTTILPGIDVDLVRSGDGARGRRELGLTPDAPLVAMFGRLTFLKSQTDVVRAAALLRDRFPDLRVVICGGGGETGYGRRVADLRDELGLGEEILLPGFVPLQTKLDLLAAADVVVHLARRESFGLTVAEAQAAGDPVVAVDAIGPRSLIDDGTTGLLVPPDDPDRLAEVLGALLDDPARRAAMGAAAAAAGGRHSITTMVEGVERVWEQVLARP